MPSKKRPPRSSQPAPPWQVILEEMRSQNRTTLEAAEAHYEEMRREVQNFRGEVHADGSVLRTLVQSHSIDMRDLKAGMVRVEAKVDRIESTVSELDGKVHRLASKVDTLDGKIEKLDGKVEKLVPLEDRVAALERR